MAGGDSACPERGVTGSKMQGPRNRDNVKQRDKPSPQQGAPPPQSLSSLSSRGLTHKLALAPGRAPFACGPDAAAAARCGPSRRRRARKDRKGRRVPPWPRTARARAGGAEPPGDSRTSGRQRRGIPGCTKPVCRGDLDTSKQVLLWPSQNLQPKRSKFLSWGKQRGSQPP